MTIEDCSSRHVEKLQAKKEHPGLFPPLNALRAFESSGRHLNFRLAAEELNVTHGAVAQQVRGLEARLGVQLFERLPRGLSLTQEGQKFHKPISQAFRLIEGATSELLSGPVILTISVPPTFATKWLVPRLGQFTSAYPEIDVRVIASEGLSDFQSDGVDIAVRQGKSPVGDGIQVEPLLSPDIHPVCSPSLASGPSPIKTPADLQNHVLLYDTHDLWPLFLNDVLKDRDQHRIRSIRFSQTALAIEAAIAGQGVALVSDIFVADDIAAGRLCRPLETGIDGKAGFFLVTPLHQRHPGEVKKMRDWLKAQANEFQAGE